MTQFCQECGVSVVPAQRFCRACGTALAVQSEPPAVPSPSSAGVRKTSTATAESAGRSCPYCRFPLKEDTRISECPICAALHHEDCYSENGACAVPGCADGALKHLSVSTKPVSRTYDPAGQPTAVHSIAAPPTMEDEATIGETREARSDRSSPRRGGRWTRFVVAPVLATLVALAGAAAGLLLSHGGLIATATGQAARGSAAKATSSSSTIAAAGPFALAPASTPPEVDECSMQLQIGADGSAGPLTCPNGRLNVLAWQRVAQGNPLVMALGPNATPDQALRAMCSDLHTSSIPIETSAYRLAALYYGWKFGVDPGQGYWAGSC